MKRFYFITAGVQQDRSKVSIKYKLGVDYFSLSYFKDEETPEQGAILAECITQGLDPTVIAELRASGRGTQR
jgi:hypothetical protein